MQFALKLNIICLWLLYGQVLGQDIMPEFPEDFPTTTTEAVPTTTTAPTTTSTLPPTTTIEPATELSTTTTIEPATELPTTTTTTKATTTQLPTTSTSRTPTTSTTELPIIAPTLPSFTRPPYYHPTYAPATRPPHFTPAYHWLWDLQESEEVARCYLRDQVERSQFRWKCGHSSSMPVISCYRCCYYGNSRFAGCSKLHNGRCTEISINYQI